MLVLSRKRNEGFWIGPGIHVLLVEQRGDKVRLGIDAPDNVEIFRDEVLERDPQLKLEFFGEDQKSEDGGQRSEPATTDGGL